MRVIRRGHGPTFFCAPRAWRIESLGLWDFEHPLMKTARPWQKLPRAEHPRMLSRKA
jgi:hypothetical protein